MKEDHVLAFPFLHIDVCIMIPTHTLRRVHGRWRHLLFPLPVRARRYCWFKRDLTERNEAALRLPYYQIKPIDVVIPEEQKPMIQSNMILNPAVIDDLRRKTLVLTEHPGPLPEEDLSDEALEASADSEKKSEHPFNGINNIRHRFHAYYPAYQRTQECQSPYTIK